MGTAQPGGNVTAGLAGFVVLFALILVCWFLFRDMSKRLRNVRRAEELEGLQPSQGELVERAAHRVPDEMPSGSEGEESTDETGPTDDRRS